MLGRQSGHVQQSVWCWTDSSRQTPFYSLQMEFRKEEASVYIITTPDCLPGGQANSAVSTSSLVIRQEKEIPRGHTQKVPPRSVSCPERTKGESKRRSTPEQTAPAGQT